MPFHLLPEVTEKPVWLPDFFDPETKHATTTTLSVCVVHVREFNLGGKDLGFDSLGIIKYLGYRHFSSSSMVD